MSQNRGEHDDVEKTHWYSNEGFNRLSIWRDSLAAYYERIQTSGLSSLRRRRASHPQAPYWGFNRGRTGGHRGQAMGWQAPRFATKSI
jgi:hypothetical protein